jgi:hypothetical protein
VLDEIAHIEFMLGTTWIKRWTNFVRAGGIDVWQCVYQCALVVAGMRCYNCLFVNARHLLVMSWRRVHPFHAIVICEVDLEGVPINHFLPMQFPFQIIRYAAIDSKAKAPIRGDGYVVL